MNKKHLCWSCANCTDINKCEFVRNLHKFYEEQRKDFDCTQKIYKKHYKYKEIEDLTKFYIPGTEVDQKGNIIKCKCYKKDESAKAETLLDYLTRYAKQSNCSVENVRRKIVVLDNHLKHKEFE